MKLDVYSCECDKAFLVRDGEEPNHCPFCSSSELSWSHQIDERGDSDV